MKKLKTIIQYECVTSFKYVLVFYAILWTVVAILFLLTYMGTGSLENPYCNGLEMNSMIYLGILGAMGFKEDFRMLLQNGFTRKYIFVGTITLFAFISAIMAIVDIAMGQFLHSISGYHSMFGGIYGYQSSIFMNFLWLFLVYLMISCLSYLVILFQSKVGKRNFIYIATCVGLIIFLIIPAIFEFVLPLETVSLLVRSFVTAFGLLTNGVINFIYPIVTFSLLIGILTLCAYAVIKRIELK